MERFQTFNVGISNGNDEMPDQKINFGSKFAVLKNSSVLPLLMLED